MISLEWVIKSLDPRPRAINIGREGCTVKLCLCVIYMDIYIYIYMCVCWNGYSMEMYVLLCAEYFFHGCECVNMYVQIRWKSYV